MKIINELQKLSYSLGINIARSLQNQGVEELNAELFAQAIEDSFVESDLKMNDNEAGAFLNQHFSGLQARKNEGVTKAGKEFLATNSKKEGVFTLESGLQYQVLKEGEIIHLE